MKTIPGCTVEVDCTLILAECSELPGQTEEQRRAFSAWSHPVGMRLRSSTSQGGIQAVSSLSTGVFLPLLGA